MESWHSMPLQEVMSRLRTDALAGLDEARAHSRLASTGPNALATAERPTLFSIFASQFRDFMILVLVGATIVAALLGERIDALAIIAILFLNAALGTYQEYRAEMALESLKALSAPVAKVIRGSCIHRIPAEEVVPGDIALIEAGDRVPADARLLEAVALEVDESVLTGEALAVAKNPLDVLESSVGLGDRVNMVYLGTVITRGRGKAIVVATGMDTQMGMIASMLSESGPDATPLQKRLGHLGRYLVVLCGIVCLAVALLGLIRGEDPTVMLLTGVSLAVAAIPEGLPAVVTVALALGVQRMVRGNAIVRRLPAVETLGCATAICSDKTGTLTQNRMVVTEVYSGGTLYALGGKGSGPQPGLDRVLLAGALCNNAEVRRPGLMGLGRGNTEGDPTEVALLVAAMAQGVYPRLTHGYRRLAEIPFESERRMMTVLVKSGLERLLLVKGAPEAITARSSALAWGPLNGPDRSEVLKVATEMAARGLRVLALAERRAVESVEGEPERDLEMLGLVGISDPPRPEAILAVKECRNAGIMTVMVTGDHRGTAMAVASKMGILRKGDKCLTGAEIDGLSDAGLRRRAREISVYARVSPAHKMRIVKALRSQGHVVAMTGDGVNDAPAVKEADIGIAMGISGTDVTREAADMVLADDNFATIAAAVREGRAIYDNIRKFVRYLLACNIGEVLTMLLAVATGLPLPLTPLQILWVNLVTDGMPAVALGLEPPGEDVMERPPRPPAEGLFARGLGIKIVSRGILIGATTLGVFAWRLGASASLAEARTWAFAVLVACQLWHVFDCRSETSGLLGVPLAKNPFLLVSVALSGLMLAAVMYYPPLQGPFRTVPLSAVDWLIVAAVSSPGSILTSLWGCASLQGGIPVEPAKTTEHTGLGGVCLGVREDGGSRQRLRIR